MGGVVGPSHLLRSHSPSAKTSLAWPGVLWKAMRAMTMGSSPASPRDGGSSAPSSPAGSELAKTAGTSAGTHEGLRPPTYGCPWQLDVAMDRPSRRSKCSKFQLYRSPCRSSHAHRRRITDPNDASPCSTMSGRCAEHEKTLCVLYSASKHILPLPPPTHAMRPSRPISGRIHWNSGACHHPAPIPEYSAGTLPKIRLCPQWWHVVEPLIAHVAQFVVDPELVDDKQEGGVATVDVLLYFLAAVSPCGLRSAMGQL